MVSDLIELLDRNHLTDMTMTYIEAYNNYLSSVETQCDQIENCIADALRDAGMEHKINFAYCSFVEHARIKLFNCAFSTKEVYEICNEALKQNDFEAFTLNILKTENIDKIEFLISVDL